MGPQITGMSSTNRILLNKGPKPNQLPSLSDYGREKMQQLGQSQMDNMRLLQGPPAMVMAGFEGGYSLGQKNLEMARSKYLVDKLTGKLSDEIRGNSKAGKLPPLTDEMRESLHSRGSDRHGEEDKEDDDGKAPTEITVKDAMSLIIAKATPDERKQLMGILESFQAQDETKARTKQVKQLIGPNPNPLF